MGPQRLNQFPMMLQQGGLPRVESPPHLDRLLTHSHDNRADTMDLARQGDELYGMGGLRESMKTPQPPA